MSVNYCMLAMASVLEFLKLSNTNSLGQSLSLESFKLFWVVIIVEIRHWDSENIFWGKFGKIFPENNSF